MQSRKRTQRVHRAAQYIIAKLLSYLNRSVCIYLNEETKYKYVDNVKIFEFLDKIYALPQNNPITPFQSSAEISTFLRSQWAGLFQRFLQEEKRLSEIRVLSEMKTVSSTLLQLVKFLTEERRSKDKAIQNILLANHPAFRRFDRVTITPYRVFFSNRQELDTWLQVRSYKKFKGEYDVGSVVEWMNTNNNEYIVLRENIFDDDDRLKPYSEEDWNDEWVERVIPPDEDDNEEEIPF